MIKANKLRKTQKVKKCTQKGTKCTQKSRKSIQKVKKVIQSVANLKQRWYNLFTDICKFKKQGGINMANKNYTIFDVANWFLSHESMPQKKLQKLCYYAQAWNLALNDCKLINTDFEAWVHGPVCRSLWNDLRDYGYSPVEINRYSKRATEINDDSSIQLLEDVWETYGGFTGFELERLTHNEEPWQFARKGYSEFEPSNVKIDNNSMKEYYRSLISSEGVGE